MKPVIHTALIALGAFAVATMIQGFYPIPVVGKYLPGGVK